MYFRSFLRDWSLPIAMISGVIMYTLFVCMPFSPSLHLLANKVVSYVQPALIFLMLFVTFCKVRINELKISVWHLWLLLFQLILFIVFSLCATFIPHLPNEIHVLLESSMICIICPTATAATVITTKLGGNASSLLSYTLLINISVAIIAPFFLTLVHPGENDSFIDSSMLIMSKVFPLLLCPLILAETLRYIFPKVHSYILRKGRNWPFYLWLIALSLAITITTRAIVHSNMPMYVMSGIAFVSFICCIIQFAFGRLIGRRYGHTVTGGQALGQKNTVFAIWLAYTYLTPVTAIAGGFYSIWHNMVNTWQLYKFNHKENKSQSD